MIIFPVIMCGGAGTRLWPASRPSRPKQFICLTGDRSLFQETALRVAPLATEGGRLVVVGGAAHGTLITEQLEELGLQAIVLLEPSPRDSAAAMAAAAVWVSRQCPAGLLAVVASDHHIPDHDAFRAAVVEAARGASEGRVVTLGIKPREASPAYGYIRPTGQGLSPIERFIEKPDALTAQSHIAAGYLWNSGNFIVSAETLLGELKAFAPDVESAAQASVPLDAPGPQIDLTLEFNEAPRISIDYAVMERTALASVLEAEFEWSDLGAWDAIAATGEGSSGLHVLEGSDGCLIRAPAGVVVAALGVSNLAIVVEPDAVLVCCLDRAQDVKNVVARVKALSASHLDFTAPPVENLVNSAARFSRWVHSRALPVWATLGQADDGAFVEALTLDARRVSAPRRARVQARQIYVYASAGAQTGWEGPWRHSVRSGLDQLFDAYQRDDGLFRTLLTADGAPLDETAWIYDQAFVLFALASAHASGAAHRDVLGPATHLRDQLVSQLLPQGGLRESGKHAYQSNCHMHLLEACLAWAEISSDPGWDALADHITRLALDRFIDPESAFLREFFDASWVPAPGDEGRLVEPGHQFEWAWLMTRYGRRRGSAEALLAAERLYEAGRRGLRGAVGHRVATDAMNDDGSTRSDHARLWPQTEWLKAALILAETAAPHCRAARLDDAREALAALWTYLTPDGLWRDKRRPGGSFVDEPAPASSFYHIMMAYEQITASQTTSRLVETS